MKRLVIFAVIMAFFFTTGCSCRKDLVFKECRVILPDRVVERGVVYIKDGKIFYAGSIYGAPSTDGFMVINAKGMTALPALINAHVYDVYYPQALKNFQSGGFGSLCDMSPYRKKTSITLKNFLSVRDRLNSGRCGSRLFSANPPLTVAGGYGAEYVNTPADAARKVKEYIAGGVDIIGITVVSHYGFKDYKPTSPEIIRAIANEAHRSGKKVSAYITSSNDIRAAVENGVDIISMVPTGFVDEDTIRLIKEKNVIVITGLEFWFIVSPSADRQWLEYAVYSLTELNKAGVPIALGTAYSAAPLKWDEGYPSVEIELMKDAGMTGLEIIKAATENAAKVTGNAKIGSLLPGMNADVILVEGRPDVDIDELKNLRYMTQYGKLVIVR